MQQNCVASWQEEPPEARLLSVLTFVNATSPVCSGVANWSAAGVRGDARTDFAASATSEVCFRCQHSERVILTGPFQISPSRSGDAWKRGRATSGRCLLLVCLPLIASHPYACNPGLLEHGRLRLSQIIQRSAVRASVPSPDRESHAARRQKQARAWQFVSPN